jgi:hypothetical protein
MGQDTFLVGKIQQLGNWHWIVYRNAPLVHLSGNKSLKQLVDSPELGQLQRGNKLNNDWPDILAKVEIARLETC